VSHSRSLFVALLTLACALSAGCGVEAERWRWPLRSSVSGWEVKQGEERIAVFEPRVYTPTVLGFRVLTVSERPNELFVDTSLFDYAAREPDGTLRDMHATRLNLGTRRADRVPADQVMALRARHDPRAIESLSGRARPSLRTAGELAHPRLAQTSWLARRHGGRSYVAAISYSDVSSIERRELNFGLFLFIPNGVHDVTYFSGVTHLELFDESRPNEPLVALSREVRNHRELMPASFEFATWTTDPDRAVLVVRDESSRLTRFLAIDVERSGETGAGGDPSSRESQPISID